jgi:hypothetical protein
VGVLLVVVFLAMFLFYLVALFKVQNILEERGESLVRPWRILDRQQEIRRIDGILSMSMRRLISGEDEEQVLSTLLINAKHIEGRAEGHLLKAIERLEDASRRDWAFDIEMRSESTEEAIRELSMARSEFLAEKPLD